MANYIYTQEHIDFVAANIKGTSYKDLTEMFNREFKFDKSINAVVCFAKGRGLKNERDCRTKTGESRPEFTATRFKPGNIPWNKGKKGVCAGNIATRFKPGHIPWNYLPVGSERVKTDGYIWVKIADPNKWRQKHILLWEAENGPVPKGHVILFSDQDPRNLSLENLLLVSSAERCIINRWGLASKDAALTRVGVNVAKVRLKIGQRSKKKEGRTKN